MKLNCCLSDCRQVSTFISIRPAASLFVSSIVSVKHVKETLVPNRLLPSPASLYLFSLRPRDEDYLQ